MRPSSNAGILIAVGLLQLIIGLKRTAPLELGGQSVWMILESGGVLLLVGYVIRFLSQAYAALKPAFLRIDSRQEDSARVLGATNWRRWRTVTFPSIKPGLAAAYTLIFLSIAKELPVTLMLMPLGKTTLAYRVFDAQQESALPDVGLAGIALLTIALILQWTIVRWRRDV